MARGEDRIGPDIGLRLSRRVTALRMLTSVAMQVSDRPQSVPLPATGGTCHPVWQASNDAAQVFGGSEVMRASCISR